MLKKYIGMVMAMLLVTMGSSAFAEDDSEVMERFRVSGAGDLIDAAYRLCGFPPPSVKVALVSAVLMVQVAFTRAMAN